MPSSAIADMMEWGPESSPERQLAFILNREYSVDQIIAQAPDAPAMKDDRPVNEYFLLTRLEKQPAK